MLSHREFLVGCNLLQCGLPLDAGANTRRAIEIARLALAIKRDRANAESWMQSEKRQARWDAWQAGERPKNLPPLQWPEIDNDPLFAPLKDYFGMYSDTFVHFTPEFIGQQQFDERPSQDSVAVVNLRYFSSDRMVIRVRSPFAESTAQFSACSMPVSTHRLLRRRLENAQGNVRPTRRGPLEAAST